MWNETSGSGRLGDMAKRPDVETAALRAVAKARADLDAAMAVVEKRRTELLAKMVDAARAEESVAAIARFAKYEAPHARRLLRDAGVEPKQPGRTPPPGFHRIPSDAK